MVKYNSYAWCLRYNICSASFLDIRIYQLVLQENGLVLDFSQASVVVHSGHSVQYPPTESDIAVARVVPIYDAANLDRTCVVSVNKEIEKDIVDECAIPSYKSLPKIDLPQCTRPNLNVVMEKYQELF